MKQKIRDLLSVNLFVSVSTRNKILQEMDVYSEDQLTALFNLLEEANQKQNLLFEGIAESNPNFLSNLQHEIANEYVRIRKETEKISHVEDEKSLLYLESELEKISVADEGK